MAAMTITLNGQQKEVPDGITIRGLLERMQIRPERVAVELNERMVRKAAYAETPVREGDRLEVVSFMGGGSGNDRSSKRKVQDEGEEQN